MDELLAGFEKVGVVHETRSYHDGVSYELFLDARVLNLAHKLSLCLDHVLTAPTAPAEPAQ